MWHHMWHIWTLEEFPLHKLVSDHVSANALRGNPLKKLCQTMWKLCPQGETHWTIFQLMYWLRPQVITPWKIVTSNVTDTALRGNPLQNLFQKMCQLCTQGVKSCKICARQCGSWGIKRKPIEKLVSANVESTFLRGNPLQN